MPKQYQFGDRADFGMQRAAVPRLSQGSPQNFTHGPATPIKPRLTFTGAQSSAKLRTLRFAGSQNVPPNIHRTFAPSFGGWRQRVSRVTPFNSELTCSVPLLALAFTPAGVFSGRRTLPASRPLACAIPVIRWSADASSDKLSSARGAPHAAARVRRSGLPVWVAPPSGSPR